MRLMPGAGLAVMAGMGELGVMAAVPAALAGDIDPPPVITGGTLTFTQDTVSNVTTVRFVGAFNTTGLTVLGTGLVPFNSRIVPSNGGVQFGPGVAQSINYNLNADIWPSYSGGQAPVLTGTFIGPDRVGFGDNGLQDVLRLSDTYVSGTPLDAAMQFTGTFATLGIAPGTYSATVPGNGPINYVFNTIPAPGAAAMLLAGGLFASARRRR